MKSKVLIVDESVVTRLMFSEIINAAPDVHVIALAGSEAQARQAIVDKKPDVMVLDASLLRARGAEFISAITGTQPMPILLTIDKAALDSPLVARARELGVVDVVVKPRTARPDAGRALAEAVCERLRSLCQAPVSMEADAEASQKTSVQSGALPATVINDKIIFIGASTGGTEAIREVLVPLPAEMPPILIVQHMPELFTASFAKRLNNLSRVTVKEAEDGEPIKAGTAYLAPGHSHLSIKRGQAGFVCSLSAAPPVNRHRPSVDVLFFSAAKIMGSSALGVLLTGMGKDGAQGMLAMRQAGAWTVAQDEDSSVVWGMPREAMMIGGANEVASLKSISALLLQRLRQGDRRAA